MTALINASTPNLRHSLPVSTKSIWSDPTWRLDGMRPGLPDSIMIIHWSLRFADDTNLLEPQYASLLDTCRRFIWAFRTNPIEGRTRNALTTMKTNWYGLRMLLTFMHARNRQRFADLSVDDVQEHIEQMRNRLGRSGKPINASSVQRFFQILVDLYIQRKVVGDGLERHPFEGLSAYQAAGARATSTPFPHLPDEIAVPLITVAADLMSCGKSLLEGAALFHEIEDAAKAAGVSRRAASIRGECMVEFKVPKAWPLFSASPGVSFLARKNHALARLRDACFIIVAALTGMRAGELLSIEVGAVINVKHSDGKRYNYVQARSYKTNGEINGEIVRWVAPPIVKEAIALLEALSAEARATIGSRHLFLAPAGREKGSYSLLTRGVTEDRLNLFCKDAGISSTFRGAHWTITVHQFRKTFARFVAARDRSHLNALSRHFKHASIAMTDKAYVGNDFELTELINAEAERQVVATVGAVLAPRKLAGKLGHHISGVPAFKGRVGAQVRENFARFILEESQAGIYAAPYGYCVFQLDTALCGGDGAKRGIPTCIKCSNFVVTPDQLPFWEAQRDENRALLAHAISQPIVRAVIEERIAEAESIVSKLALDDEALGA